MAEKRKDITQAMCDHVKLLIKGGATNKTAGALIGVSATTISRIRTAGYNAEEFRKNNEARREEEKKTGTYACVYTGVIEDKSGIELTPDGPRLKSEQIPGQMAMELPEKKMITVEVQVPEGEPVVLVNEQKIIRFLAGKMDETNKDINKVRADIQASHSEMSRLLYENISMKLDQIYNYLGQIVRRMDK